MKQLAKFVVMLLLTALIISISSCGKEKPQPQPPVVVTKNPPIVGTLIFSDRTQNSFSVSVPISGAGITSKKLYYDVTSPCYGKNETTIGELPQTVSGLIPGKLYYVCVEVTNPDGSTRSEGSVTTLETPPTVSVPTISAITNTSMTATASITGAGLTVYAKKQWTDPISGQTLTDSVNKGTIGGFVIHTWTNNIPGMQYKISFSAANAGGYINGATVTAQNSGYHVGQIVFGGQAKIWKLSADGNHFWFGVINRPYMASDPTVPAPTYVGATSTTDGKTNTSAIVNALPGVNTIAKYCYNLTLSGQVPIGTCWQGSVNEYIEISDSGVFSEIQNEGGTNAWEKGTVHSSTEITAPTNKIVGWKTPITATTAGTGTKSGKEVCFPIGYW